MNTEPMYLIWSEEHGAWWKPAFGDQTWGYTHSIVEAGRYTKDRAAGICEKANQAIHAEEGFNPGRTFNEIAIIDPI